MKTQPIGSPVRLAENVVTETAPPADQSADGAYSDGTDGPPPATPPPANGPLTSGLQPPVNRSINGSGNNPLFFRMGSAGTPLRRSADTTYSDGIAEPPTNRPNPRTISTTLLAQDKSIPDPRGLSNMTWAWGQFIDHDIDLTPEGTAENAPIPIPAGDPSFDPTGKGNQTISFHRSVVVPNTGTDVGNPRQQPNRITTWIDASNVYGSDEARAKWLRTGTGGHLKTSDGNFLPFNDGSQQNAEQIPGRTYFMAGDVRVNENIALTSLQTIFMREHNRLADEIAKANPNMSDEDIYQRARKIVGAEIEAVTYNEFLPALLGSGLDPYKGYDPRVDASISSEFSTALYRFGHSTLGHALDRVEANGKPIAAGPVLLRDGLFDPRRLQNEGGLDPLLRGLAMDRMQKVDTQIIDEVRNFLFGQPGHGGMDLATLNIQRGRDHGIAKYNDLRESLGLPRLKDFGDITSDKAVADKLRSLYGSVDNIDPWVGALAEDLAPGSSVGPTIAAGVRDQFRRLRDGDRFYYENDPGLSSTDVSTIRGTKLSDIIRRNSGASLPDNPFFATETANDSLGQH